MKLGQGDEEHVYRMGTVYLMLTDKHDKYGSDKCESYKALLGSHSNNKKITQPSWPFLDGNTKE